MIMMANAKMQDVKLITMQFQVNVKSAQQENIAHKDQLEVVRAKNQMVKHVMLILSAKVGHVVQNAVGQKENRQAVLYATMMVIVPPVVPGIS